VLPGVKCVLHNFPEHPLWVFEEVFLLDVIQWISLASLDLLVEDLSVLRNLEGGIGTTIIILMIDPPVATSALNGPGYEVFSARIRIADIQLLPQNVDGEPAFMLSLDNIL